LTGYLFYIIGALVCGSFNVLFVGLYVRSEVEEIVQTLRPDAAARIGAGTLFSTACEVTDNIF
jgi:hypothetical protein